MFEDFTSIAQPTDAVMFLATGMPPFYYRSSYRIFNLMFDRYPQAGIDNIEIPSDAKVYDAYKEIFPEIAESDIVYTGETLLHTNYGIYFKGDNAFVCVVGQHNILSGNKIHSLIFKYGYNKDMFMAVINQAYIICELHRHKLQTMDGGKTWTISDKPLSDFRPIKVNKDRIGRCPVDGTQFRIV